MLPDRFEQLCCRLLPELSEEYQGLEPSINRDGKTTKGVADAFKRLSDGSYIIFAFTTQQTSVVAKIKSDLRKVATLDVPIKKVVVCFNTPITLEHEIAYNEIAEEHNWKLEIYSLHTLVEALRNHVDVCLEFDLGAVEAVGNEQPETEGFLIGERLQQLRQELELQSSEMIKLIGYPSEKAYLEMENNIRECNGAIIAQLYTTFGVLSDWLTDGTFPKYERDRLLWWQDPEACLAQIFELDPQRLYVTLRVRKPNDWLGCLRDMKDFVFSILNASTMDSDLLSYADPFLIGIFAEVTPYRYHTYDLAAGLDSIWRSQFHRPWASRLLYQFLNTLVYRSQFEVQGVIIPEWRLNAGLYAGRLHPMQVLRQVDWTWGVEWPYEVLDLAQKRMSTRRGRRRYGRWFPRVREVFRQALAEKES
jgi:hypothetical protein